MLGTAWRHVGLVVAASAVAFAAAVVLHHVSDLPASYTWLQPLRTLRDVVGQPRFFVVLVGAFAIGRWRLRGDWLAAARATPPAIDRARALRIVVIAGAAITADAILFPDHTIPDRLALVVVAWVVGWQDLARPARRMALELVVASLAFVAICYAYTIWKATAFLGREAMDDRILAFESAIFGSYPHRAIAAWSAVHPQLIQLCNWIYFQFFAHMALTGALLVGMRRTNLRLEYLGALAICYLLGGPLYHLLPAVGPVFTDPGAYHQVAAMPLMTNSVREWLATNTSDVATHRAVDVQTWGYIACMPSLHIAQELVMTWYVRGSRFAFALSAAFTAITCLAVVVLGWHYPSDVAGGFLLAVVAIAIAHRCRAWLFPAAVMPGEDRPLPARPSLAALIAGLRRTR